MNLHKVKMEAVIPLFTGVLGSLVLCSMLAVHIPVFNEEPLPEIVEEKRVEEKPEEINHIFLTITDRYPDLIRETYRKPEHREWVTSFFTGICSNQEIAEAILENTDEFNVPPALAFALSWEESRFNPRAVNRGNLNQSIDRGLFQLNSHSFPDLEIATFFDIKENARYGISHLRFCLDSGGSEISALAMYNAGVGRVTNTGAPKVTLDYIHRILEHRRKIEGQFHERLTKEEARLSEEKPQEDPPVATAHPYLSHTLTSASPL
ncbi:MAG: lytic transglycosylase domain-containing protein [Treponema sp.]|jgi:transcription termination factor NusB|nr:lytic transglycosylase domain-containing protein [Treponema sp.]